MSTPAFGGIAPTQPGSMGAVPGTDPFGQGQKKPSLEEQVADLQVRVAALEQEEQQDENEGEGQSATPPAGS